MKRNSTILQVILLLTFFSLSRGAAAQSCNRSIPASSPETSFTSLSDGTATQKATGRMWMRCSLGQNWDGKTCGGTAATYSWEAALQAANRFDFAGHKDWRLPNKKEMETIFEESCDLPAINDSVFPATPSAFFWSSSPYAGLANGAWSVDFGYGSVIASVKSAKLNVRLVRGGR
jgi:hypothetical protein